MDHGGDADDVGSKQAGQNWGHDTNGVVRADGGHKFYGVGGNSSEAEDFGVVVVVGFTGGTTTPRVERTPQADKPRVVEVEGNIVTNGDRPGQGVDGNSLSTQEVANTRYKHSARCDYGLPVSVATPVRQSEGYGEGGSNKDLPANRTAAPPAPGLKI